MSEMFLGANDAYEHEFVLVSYEIQPIFDADDTGFRVYRNRYSV